MMMSIAIISSVSAQRHGGGFRGISTVRYVPRVSIGYGGGFGYGLGLGYGYGYPVYGANPYGYNGIARQSKLTRQIDDIKSDYADKIYAARNATDLDGKQRRAVVKQLKQERDNTINNLRNNYYKKPVQNQVQYSAPNNVNPDDATPKVQE